MFYVTNISYISSPMDGFHIYIVYPLKTPKRVLSTVSWTLLIHKYTQLLA